MIALKMKKILISSLLFLIAGYTFSQSGAYEIHGRIVSEEGSLPGATVVLHELKKGLVSDNDGYFRFSKIKAGNYHLHISYLGYESVRLDIRVPNGEKEMIIKLTKSSIELSSLTVEANPFRSGPKAQAQTIKVLDEEFLQENLSNTLVNTLEKVAGINAINTGVGIAKPVIRGMSFNRIMVNDHGIKQEGQQWGSDHGLELDMFDVSRVEIIKGPGSLIYGSDGMGGVININSLSFPKENTIRGSVRSIFRSNNRMRGGSAMVEGNKDGFIFKARVSALDFDNYRIPASSFSYGGFLIPISNNTLRNTAGQERNFSFMTGINKSWGYSSFSVSRFYQRVGLFPGAVGRPTSFVLNRYDPVASIDLPRQVNEHWKAIWNNNIQIGKNWLETDLAFQSNIRREESLPHAHNVGPNEAGNLALGLNLNTWTANMRYHQQINGKWKNIYGLQAQRMQNTYRGFEFLLPAFISTSLGVFSYAEYKALPSLNLSGGIRYDFGRHDIQRHEQPVYRNFRETGEIDVRNEALNRSFQNPVASLGMSWTPLEKVNFKYHVASSFRIPTAIELSSNGIHHGTFRHEKGNPELNSERGIQMDWNASYKSKRFYLALTPFFSYYSNYIYLAPTAFFSTLPSGNQLTWEYRQHEARFMGAEIETEYHIWKNLHLGLAAEYVRSYNLSTKLPLPLTPPGSILGEIQYRKDYSKKILTLFYVSVNARMVAAQNRVDRNERRTAGYHLIGASAGLHWKIFKQEIQTSVNVDNALNTAYFNHLSRYRLLNLPEQGRNISVQLSIPIQK